MKNNLIVLTLILAGTASGFSQKKYVTSAINSVKSKKIIKAKNYIDKATKHESTKNKPKTWRWKAEICARLITSNSPKVAELKKTTDLKSEMNEALAMTNKLDKDGEYKNELRQLVGPLYTIELRAGIKAYNAGDYKTALTNFNSSQEYGSFIGITDSTGAYNGALAAQRLKDYPNAIKNYKKCIEIGYGGTNVYFNLADIYNKTDKKEEANKVITMAKEKFPNDPEVIFMETSKYIEANELDKAKVSLEAALAKFPNNAKLQSAAGVAYTKMKLYDKAIAAYTIALKINPKDEISKYNMCIVYNNIVNEKSEAIDDIDINDNEKYVAAIKERDVYINKVLPFIEKTYEEQKEPALKRILNSFYGVTKQQDKIIK